MQTPSIPEIERAIRAQNLIEINQAIFARINAVPKILGKGENTIPDNATLYMSGITGNVFVGEMPCTKEPRFYPAGEREKFFGAQADTVEKISLPDLQTALTPLTIYCTKTGQPIGPINSDSLIAAMAIYSREQMADLLFRANTNSVHPAWVQTASNEQFNEILDKLATHDPRGFTVYCLGIIANGIGHAKNWRNKSVEFLATQHWQRARAWQILSLLPQEEFAELNDTLSAFISYMPSSLQQLCLLLGQERIVPDLMARKIVARDFVEKLVTAMDNTLTTLVRGKEAEDRSIYLTNLALDELRRGASQIKKLRRTIRRENVLVRKYKATKAEKKEKLNKELANTYGLADLFEKKTMPGQESWRLRTKTGVTITTPNLDAEKTEIPLEFLNAIDLSEISNTEDDNTVEIRRITRDELPSVQAAKEVAEQKAAENPPKKFSLANRGAINRPAEIPAQKIGKFSLANRLNRKG